MPFYVDLGVGQIYMCRHLALFDYQKGKSFSDAFPKKKQYFMLKKGIDLGRETP